MVSPHCLQAARDGAVCELSAAAVGAAALLYDGVATDDAACDDVVYDGIGRDDAACDGARHDGAVCDGVVCNDAV